MIEMLEKKLINDKQTQKKPKLVLVQCRLSPALKMALKQFRDFGFEIHLQMMKGPEDLIEQTLRIKPDILFIDAFGQERPILNLIKSIRSYTLLKDIILIVYFEHDDGAKQLGENQGEEPLQDDIHELCVESGATEFIGHLDRESFLSALFKYGKSC